MDDLYEKVLILENKLRLRDKKIAELLDENDELREDNDRLQGLYQDEHCEVLRLKGIQMRKLIIAVDFDGTITKEQQYPEVGEINPEAIRVLKKLQNKCVLCLWTCRAGEELNNAIKKLKDEFDFEFDYINYSPVSTGSPKIVADLYIDDRILGGLLSWDRIEEYLDKCL